MHFAEVEMETVDAGYRGDMRPASSTTAAKAQFMTDSGGNREKGGGGGVRMQSMELI
eukprot:COSAG02_NODE_283_length_25709_cov_24.523311_10_plen_57_part_00